jgi:hypothetical protein
MVRLQHCAAQGEAKSANPCSARLQGVKGKPGGRTVEGERLDVLEIVGEGHKLVAEADRVLALRDAVKLLEVGVGDGLRDASIKGNRVRVGSERWTTRRAAARKARDREEGPTRRGKYIWRKERGIEHAWVSHSSSHAGER